MNDLPFFHTIHILTRCEVSLRKDRSSTIYVNENEVPAKWIDYSVVNNELIIQTMPKYYGLLVLSGVFPKIEISCSDLTGIKVLDSAHLFTKQAFSVPKLGIIVGGGSIDLMVNAALVDCTVLKRGRAKISGNTCVSRTLTYHGGIYDGCELETSEAYVDVFGDSETSIWASEEVEFSLSGRGKINYRGSPRIKIVRFENGCSIMPIERSGLINY